MKNNYYLVCSSCLFLVGVIYFICNFENNNYEILLALLLLTNVILSILFWMKAEYKSIIHKFDGLFAKLSFIFFTCYILLLKEECPKCHKIITSILIIISLILFYLSDKFSKKSWCSRKHIITHSILHLVGMIVTTSAFI